MKRLVLLFLLVAGPAGAQISVTSVSPTSGPVTGGTVLTITGTGFLTGARAYLNGILMTGCSVVSDTKIQCTTPGDSLASTTNSLKDVQVINPDSTGVNFHNAFNYDFCDIPATCLPDHTFVTELALSRVTAGCGQVANCHNRCTGGAGSGQRGFCPLNIVVRSQMAVFVTAAEHSADFKPEPPGSYFTDVSNTNVAAPFIYRIYNEGVTGGCGQGLFCPTTAIVRAQMAVFLETSIHGSLTIPPSCQSTQQFIPGTTQKQPGYNPFFDISNTSPFCPWIAALYFDGVTSGCGRVGGHLDFCPFGTVSRENMAVFLVAGFALP